MVPYYDYQCDSKDGCGHVMYDVRATYEEKTIKCDHCDRAARRLGVAAAGYTGNMGASSTRPKNSTCKGSYKTFTKEPEQLELDFNKKEE